MLSLERIRSLAPSFLTVDSLSHYKDDLYELTVAFPDGHRVTHVAPKKQFTEKYIDSVFMHLGYALTKRREALYGRSVSL